MAKMTEAQLSTFTAGYVDALKQAGTYVSSANNLYGLVDKIGKQVTLEGDFKDELPELNGDNLENGKTIEETLIDLVMPTVYGTDGTMSETNATTEGAYDLTPAYPSIEDASYSYSLGRIKAKTTRPYNYIENGCNDSAFAGKLVASINKSLTVSMVETKNAIKRQLLGRVIDKAVAAGLKATVALPVDEETSEAFITQVKNDVEEASFSGEGKSLSGAYIGAAPTLTLFVKKGVMPTVQVKALAGAIQLEQLAIPATIKVVKDFGTLTEDANVWALLADTRGIKLHNSYKAIRVTENGDGDFINFIEHDEDTAFISKHVNFKAYTTTAE